MADKYLGKDYTVSDIEVKIVDSIPDPDNPSGIPALQMQWVHYEHIRMEIVAYHGEDDTYTAELKTGDQHDGKRIKVSRVALDAGLGD